MRVVQIVLLSALLVGGIGCGGETNPVQSAANVTVGSVKGILSTSRRGEYLARAKEGDVEAMFLLGQAYCCGYSGVLNTNRALEWFCQAARKGHAEAQIEISKIHSRDYGIETLSVPPDYAIALMWYELGSETGRVYDEPYRARLMQKVTPADIKKARELQKDWKKAPCEI